MAMLMKKGSNGEEFQFVWRFANPQRVSTISLGALVVKIRLNCTLLSTVLV